MIEGVKLERGRFYGYRKISDDPRDLGERCGKHRAYRLMKEEGLRSQTEYRRRAGRYHKTSVVPPNQLE